MRRRQQPPLGKRHGLDPARLRLPEDGGWATIRDHLVERLPRVPVERIDQLLVEGGIVDLDGPIAPDAPYVPGGAVWFHRDLPTETEVPFDLTIVHRDDDLLVVDKPHFLSTIPRGQHILQTALVRLRRELDLPDLVPAHRLDRATAGLVLFIANPARRGAYQTMFHKRRVYKEYEAIARYDPQLELPRTVRSRIIKERHILRAFEVDGEPNAETRVELLEHRDGLGRYRLIPHTGRTHQLRLHMNGLGIPILGDDFYPELTDRPVDDFTRPLQLLAATLEFTDPITREPRRFRTTRTLQAWTDPDGWVSHV
ncbi:RluA family pseudouridine synthase [Nocardia transvalensis]|uniref:RluA family pseudouridine synthase n=1 Tax=Nocardia transvalensis TaxID=37333 RepID=UPI001892DDB6|nr:RluA family pseudouridine synthase [Nocardia transvalensis]MBF6327590.1 RluA family pseudouridine synthase [Nocardia transvalensis]